MADFVSSSSMSGVIKKCMKGDRSSFRELYRMYKDRLYSTCVRLLGNTEDAEDALQETFVKVYNNIGKFRGDSSINTWLYRIAVNTCIEHTRKWKHESHHESLDDPEIKAPSPAAKKEHIDMKLIVEKEIEQLPEGCRTVFVLHTIEGFKHKEIAEMLDISDGTSKSQLSLAKEKLREQLMPYREVMTNEL